MSRYKRIPLSATILCLLSSLYGVSAFAIDPVSVTASSNDGNIPENTLDNNLETRWSAIGDGQWIEYDLGKNYIVKDVQIAFYKGDQRTATIEIQVSSDGNTWESLFYGDQPSKTLDLQIFDVDDTEARYVRIVGYGNTSNNWNSFTEVAISASEVASGEIVNLALGKSTSQSSTDYSGISSRAVDGDVRGNWSSNTITHTENEIQPWWQVDLGSVSTISTINLYNRTDSCCSSRLSNFYVLVSDKPFSSNDLNVLLAQDDVASYYYGSTAGSPTSIDINRSGRYVRVQLAGSNPLSLAEVEVYGVEATGSLFIVPGKIEAEDFSNYSDADTENRGGAYRPDEGVDIQETTDSGGGYNVGWMDAGEWLEYPIYVSNTGEYSAQLRLASPSDTGQISIEVDGVVVAQHGVASTGGWQNWNTEEFYLGNISAGTHTLRINVESAAFNLNWLNIIDNVSSIREGATYVGGGGTVAGALPVSCETPAGFTLVDSLPEMIEAMGKNNVKVALKPGTYVIDESDTSLFTSQSLPGGKAASTLLPVDGHNSHYDFRCAYIKFDTDLWRQFGKNEVIQLRTVGNYNTISNLSIEDIGDTSPSGGALGVMMDGRDNVIEGLIITSRGSQPYGLGDAYGKGAGPVLSHQKHSSVLIRGLRNTFRNSTVFNYSYGHSVFMQGSEDTLIDGIYVQGELRSTADMLAANNPRFVAADARAASVDFMTVWGYKLPTGYWMSLQEAGIRAYNGGNTIIDGVEYERGADTVTVLNSVIRNTRTGVTLVHATGSKYVENTTVIGCEQGYSIGSGNIVSSYADADVGPVITFAYSSDNGTKADITVLPTDGSKNGWGALAFIGGKNHDITLRSSQTDIPSNLQVVLSGDKHSIRHLEDSLQNQDQLTLTNSVVNNLTNFPVLINNLASGVNGQSNGPVSGNTSDNNIQQN
ncbi:discoidin domain-containing protein [Microbulbifer thermotolerans]|uniref:galactose-binding domain-containing protein n=1 Tax=Microbulbifer thermotolerans TaxID=252514 RepID=UPI00224A561B|nr:discoidin domain-containing protein [Microbulbifer thermotolerans]MCX2842003.1 discoidin domain-containing protein [Microbulbifer thermotolerans]